MFVIAFLVWRSLMFDIAVVATVTANAAVVDSNIGKANNIRQQASQQTIQHSN
jgi:hypothetical protein